MIYFPKGFPPKANVPSCMSPAGLKFHVGHSRPCPLEASDLGALIIRDRDLAIRDRDHPFQDRDL